MKYIDAEKLNAEIERLYDGEAPKHDQQCDFDDGYFTGIGAISQFIDSLQQEQPEQHTRGYDEDYLNEKIAKATKSWKGVDVDKFMDEMRGREPETDLEKEVNRYYFDNFAYISSDQPTLSIVTNIARHFAEWGADHLRDSTKMVDKGLDEAATKFAYSEGYQDPEYYNIVDAFKAGAKWMAQQGFSQEETVEDKTLELGYDVLPGIDPIINLPNSFKPGDKVIVQVRKK